MKIHITYATQAPCEEEMRSRVELETLKIFRLTRDMNIQFEFAYIITITATLCDKYTILVNFP